MTISAPQHAAASVSRADRPLRIQFFLRAINFDRMYEGLLRGLLARGHTIHVETEGERGRLPPGNYFIFDALAAEWPGSFFYSQRGAGPDRAARKRRSDSWLPLAGALRCSIDFLRFLEPEFETATALRDRARDRTPLVLRLLMRWRLMRLRPVRHGLDRVLRALEAALPLSKEAGERIDRVDPDLVMIAPLVGIGEAQADYLRAARRRGIRALLPVASWDNLTNKGVLRDTPDLTIVWNGIQVREGEELHRLPADRIVATGAHSFDHWFEWGPSTSREEFLGKLGLPGDQPCLMYVCSSYFIAGDEVQFVKEWVARLRTVAPPELSGAGVLVRPHPQNTAIWHEHDLADPRTVVWPREGAVPTEDHHKRNYYDSIFHSAAVVGINTSALLETAILRRGVYTIRTPRHRHSQGGTIHFGYLAGTDGDGILVSASSWEEHFAQLVEAARDRDGQRERIERFLVHFLRPHGLERPAVPLAIEAIEGAMDRPPVESARAHLLARATMRVLLVLVRPSVVTWRWLRRSRLALVVASLRAATRSGARRAIIKERERAARRRHRRLRGARFAGRQTAKRAEVLHGKAGNVQKDEGESKPAESSREASNESQPAKLSESAADTSAWKAEGREQQRQGQVKAGTRDVGG